MANKGIQLGVLPGSNTISPSDRAVRLQSSNIAKFTTTGRYGIWHVAHMGVHTRGLWYQQPCLQSLRVPRDGRGQFQYMNGHHCGYGTDGDGSQSYHCWVGCRAAH